MSNADNISQEKKEVIKNLYLSGIGEEFIAIQLDVEIPVVVRVLKELGEYKLELEAIDSIKASHEMNKEERVKIIKTIISDETIKKILDKQIAANGRE